MHFNNVITRICKEMYGRVYCLPCDVCCVFDEFCDDNDGRYGGKLIFDRIFTDDELRWLAPFSPRDDGDSFDEAAFRFNVSINLFIS